MLKIGSSFKEFTEYKEERRKFFKSLCLSYLIDKSALKKANGMNGSRIPVPSFAEYWKLCILEDIADALRKNNQHTGCQCAGEGSEDTICRKRDAGQ